MRQENVVAVEVGDDDAGKGGMAHGVADEGHAAQDDIAAEDGAGGADHEDRQEGGAHEGEMEGGEKEVHGFSLTAALRPFLGFRSVTSSMDPACSVQPQER